MLTLKLPTLSLSPLVDRSEVKDKIDVLRKKRLGSMRYLTILIPRLFIHVVFKGQDRPLKTEDLDEEGGRVSLDMFCWLQ